MNATSTARTRRWRDRHRTGRAVFAVELDEADLHALLVDAGLLSPLADDHQSIERALQKQMEIILSEHKRGM